VVINSLVRDLQLATPCAYKLLHAIALLPLLFLFFSGFFAFVFLLASQCTRRVRKRARGKLTDKSREAADRSETWSGDTHIAFWFRGLCLQESSQRIIVAIAGCVMYNKTPFFSFFFFLVISFVVLLLLVLVLLLLVGRLLL